MKAEERHELKTNELAQWILTLPQQIKENLQAILYVSVAVVLIAAASFYYLYQRNAALVKNQADLTRLINILSQSKAQIMQAQSQGVDMSYNLIQTADELDVASQNTKNDNAVALALIKRAEAFRMELHYRPSAVSRETLAGQINLAKAAYEKAFEKAHNDPALMAQAKYGMGLCDEELGDFAAAAKTYHEIVNDKNFEGTIAAAQATYRLAIMTDYEKPVTFKPAPQPVQPAAPLGPRVDVPVIAPMPPQAKPVETPSAGQK